jgi:uncharacterized protein YecT (DUF1311 family)
LTANLKILGKLPDKCQVLYYIKNHDPGKLSINCEKASFDLAILSMYKRVSRFVLVAIAPLSILVISPSSIAQTRTINCSKATATPEVKFCSQQSYQAADKKLNQVYQEVTSSLSSEPKQLLISGQQSWIKFRDNNCNFEVYNSRGGTGYEIFRNGCLERLTKQRTKDLQDYLSSR